MQSRLGCINRAILDGGREVGYRVWGCNYMIFWAIAAPTVELKVAPLMSQTQITVDKQHNLSLKCIKLITLAVSALRFKKISFPNNCSTTAAMTTVKESARRNYEACVVMMVLAAFSICLKLYSGCIRLKKPLKGPDWCCLIAFAIFYAQCAIILEYAFLLQHISDIIDDGAWGGVGKDLSRKYSPPVWPSDSGGGDVEPVPVGGVRVDREANVI